MGPQPKRCHLCKAEDHLIADCPSRPQGETRQGNDNGTNNGTVSEKDLSEKKAVK